MAKDPAVLFYYQDFLVGTEFMDDEEVGKYIRLLCHQADKGRLSKKQVLSVCKAHAIPDFITEKFTVDENGLYYNERMEVEKTKRSRFVESRRKSALFSKKDNSIRKAYAERTEDEDEDEDENGNKDINDSSKGGEGGNQDEDIQKLNVYWSANLFPPKIAHKEFVEELYKKFGIEKTKQIIKKFSEGNFRNLNTMKESLDDNGNIKPRDQINRGNSGTKPDIIKSSGGTSNFDPSKSKYKIIGGAGGEPS